MKAGRIEFAEEMGGVAGTDWKGLFGKFLFSGKDGFVSGISRAAGDCSPEGFSGAGGKERFSVSEISLSEGPFSKLARSSLKVRTLPYEFGRALAVSGSFVPGSVFLNWNICISLPARVATQSVAGGRITNFQQYFVISSLFSFYFGKDYSLFPILHYFPSLA